MGNDWGCADFRKASHTDRTKQDEITTTSFQCQCALMDSIDRSCVDDGEWRIACVDTEFSNGAMAFGGVTSHLWLGASSLLGAVASSYLSSM